MRHFTREPSRRARLNSYTALHPLYRTMPATVDLPEARNRPDQGFLRWLCRSIVARSDELAAARRRQAKAA